MYVRKFFRFMEGADGEPDRGDSWTPTDDAGEQHARLGTDDAAADAAAADAAANEVAKAAALKEVPKAGEGADEGKPKVDEAKVDETKPKDTRIPAARHKEILDKERERREAVETELAKYKQGTAIAATNADITKAEGELLELEKTYAKLLTDGQPDKAAEMMSKIRKMERAINESNSTMREQAATARAVETVRYDTTVERLEELYPALNQDHDDFDKTKTAEVLELKAAYQTQGYTPSAALQKAVKLIMPPTTKKQETALEVEARVDPKAVEAARKAAAVGKTAEAVNKTPANASKVGLDSDKTGGGAVTAKDAIKMPYKDFTKLDEDSLAAMRGDVL